VRERWLESQLFISAVWRQGAVMSDKLELMWGEWRTAVSVCSPGGSVGRREERRASGGGTDSHLLTCRLLS